jgi:hypothetical protein
MILGRTQIVIARSDSDEAIQFRASRWIASPSLAMTGTLVTPKIIQP